LTRAGEKLQAGQIYESNSVLLSALLNRWGVVVASHEHCADDANSLRAAFEAAASNHILIVNGGVSVGEHDLVQSTLRALGAKIDIWRVTIKPGKPFLFGRLGDCFVFGLPGNPVSAFVTFLRFVRPAILKMMGAHDLDLTKTTAKLTVDLTNDSERVHYLRGKLENGTFAPIGRQESHALFGLSQSNALLCLAPGAKAEKGTTVNVELWD
jgi:molybdopterin molybdotransferase